MSVTRKALLGAGAGAAATAALASRPLKALASPAEPDVNFVGAPILPHDRIGIQLFTIRDQVSSLGFAKVFETLAGMGFKGVEFAGYTQGSVGAITVQQIRSLLDANGLKGIGSHVSATTSNIQSVLDNAQVLGLPYVGLASVSSTEGTLAAWKQAAANLNTMGAAARDRGIKFYWHNHDGEFGFVRDAPTTRIYDVLLAETDPDLVFMEMDIYWAYVGQYKYGRWPLPTFDPLDYVKAHRSRYPLFHVKDGRANTASPNGYDMVDIGQGSIDFERFFCEVGEPTLHWYLYERDNASSHPKGSMASAECSFLMMRYGLRGC